jgi:cell division protein ZapA
MGQVSVTLNGRTYRLACGDGEEARLAEIATYVKSKLDQLAIEFGQAGDDRLLLMTALMVTDELYDLKAASEDTGEAAETLKAAASAGANQAGSPSASAGRIEVPGALSPRKSAKA